MQSALHSWRNERRADQETALRTDPRGLIPDFEQPKVKRDEGPGCLAQLADVEPEDVKLGGLVK